jgi:hypothetical protein
MELATTRSNFTGMASNALGIKSHRDQEPK